MNKTTLLAVFAFSVLVLPAQSQLDPWGQAEKNGLLTQQVIQFSEKFVWGWLDQADPESGLIPRNLKTDRYWNARDAAADNYPFMVLTAEITGNPHLLTVLRNILETEQRLTNRVGLLPDDFLFATQTFRTETPDLAQLIFGAAEYSKDGLLPITEWIGPSPWLDRMNGLIEAIWDHADLDTRHGKIPTDNVEVNGDLLQTMSRLYWMDRSPVMKERLYRLSDLYLIEKDLTQMDKLRLEDHGCEVIEGLTEAYLIASQEDPDRCALYREPLHKILDTVLKYGRTPEGLLYGAIDPRDGKVLSQELTDNWGYNYNAFLVVADIDKVPQYREAVQHVLENIHKAIDYKWENGSADGYADSIEGGINLLNRVPVESAFGWVDDSMQILLSKQRPDGVIEGWHGDGNSARTSLMYALMKTQGTTLRPWRQDHQLGAVSPEAGKVLISLKSEWAWQGVLRFDRPRHRDTFNMPVDYARLNQFPEWYTVEPEADYTVQVNDDPPSQRKGRELIEGLPLQLKAASGLRLSVTRNP